MPGSLTNSIAISAGSEQSLALRRDSTVIQWGKTFGSVPLPLSNVTAIASGTKLLLRTVVLWSALLKIATISHAQGNFVNLGFESASLPTLPPGQEGTASTSAAFPGWTAFLGTEQQTTVLYNSQTFGLASISVIGPNWRPGGAVIPAFEGNYMAILMAGAGPSGFVAASLSQTGVVP